MESLVCVTRRADRERARGPLQGSAGGSWGRRGGLPSQGLALLTAAATSCGICSGFSKTESCSGSHVSASLPSQLLSRAAAAARTEEPASWAASAPVRRSSPGGTASTTSASGEATPGDPPRPWPGPCSSAVFTLLWLCRSCGLISHGEWVQKGCSYCRCGYGILHCFANIFHKDCGKRRRSRPRAH